MTDILIGYEPDKICDDCGAKGAAGSHWGSLIPPGAGSAAFCSSCWTLRMNADEAGFEPRRVGYVKTRNWGRTVCYQDHCENCVFSSIGGRDSRDCFMLPEWVSEEQQADFAIGYAEMAEEMFGADWQTCTFSWQHALTINP